MIFFIPRSGALTLKQLALLKTIIFMSFTDVQIVYKTVIPDNTDVARDCCI